MDIKEIQSLIKFVAKSGASEVKLETDEIKITIRTGALSSAHETTTYLQQIPVGAAPAGPSFAPASNEDAGASGANKDASSPEEDSRYITIKSPIIGTFYRKPSPDKPSFIEVGDNIGQGDVLCVIEAMKLFNDIESEVSGKIIKVLVEDSSPVEFDQPLFLVDPS